MKKRLLGIVLALCLLTGCAPLLEREYSAVEPHSSKFWESEAAGTLRAENYQDIVNDLLILIGQHAETGTLRLYNFSDDLTVLDILDRATVEIQQETPLGAYAVEYITSYSQAQHGYYEVTLQIGYRRTVEQIQSIVNATSPEAITSLLESALDAGRTELAVRIGYWGTDGREKVESAMLQLREERGLAETPMWVVNYYPASGKVGLLEFLLDPPEQLQGTPEVTVETAEEAEEADIAEELMEEPEAPEEKFEKIEKDA